MQNPEANQTHLTLHTGAKIPIIGYGSFDYFKDTTDIIKTAVVDAGYRHIDTASMYKNEEYIGNALQEIFNGPYDIKREDIFITTKLNAQEKEDPRAALKASLEKLKLDYVDLYLIHFPLNPVITKEDGTKEFARIPLHKLWKQLEDLVKEGLTKHIGISNFNIQLILDLLTYAEIKPAVNQVEIHPYLVQYDLVEYLKKLGIIVTAYSPLGSPQNLMKKLNKVLLEDQLLVDLAAKYNKTPAQIAINWSIQRGQVVIPKAAGLKRMKENIESINFTLSKEDVEAINALDARDRIIEPKNWADSFNTPLFS